MPTARRKIPLRVCGRHLPQAKLGGEYENVDVLVAIAVNEDGCREVLGAAEGMKEDKVSWVSFFQWLRGRGLSGVKLIVGDKCLVMLEAAKKVEAGIEETLTYCNFPSAHWVKT